MPHIQIKNDLPGILGLLEAYPETAKPLCDIAEAVLVKDTLTFSKAERETVAAYVSYLNQCQFCSESHAAVADEHWGQSGFSKKVWTHNKSAEISLKLQALLDIAKVVQEDPKMMSADLSKIALNQGATEQDIHDTVLIAAMFCMYNRYVDGLGTVAPPRGHNSYQETGRHLSRNGYVRPRS